MSCVLEGCVDPARYPQQGDAWHIPKLYYDRIFNGEKVRTHAAMVEAQHPRATQMVSSWPGWAIGPIRHRPHSGRGLSRRVTPRCGLASQVDPQSPFFFWPNDILRAAWPYDDFELVESTVSSHNPETDLFAGIEDTE